MVVSCSLLNCSPVIAAALGITRGLAEVYVLTIDNDYEKANALHSSTNSILKVSVRVLAVSEEKVLVMVILA